MKKRYILKLCILISFFQINAQSDFRSGYIIKNTKDTIYGLVAYQSDMLSAKKCVFKNEINSEEQVFKPSMIKGYRFIESKYFISKEIKTENTSKLIFLEYLVNGVIDMYYYRDTRGDHYYVDNGNGELYELKNEEKTVIKNNTTYSKKSKEYIGALKYVFKESPSTVKNVDNLKLNHQSLINITLDYHKEVCPDQMCLVYEKKSPKIKNTFGFIFGLNLSSISEHDVVDKYYYLKDSDFDYYLSPSIGMYYKVHLPRFNEKLFFQYEGTFSYFKQTTSNLYTQEIFYTNYYNDIDYEQYTFSNEFLFKYETSQKRKFSPTFSIGAFFNYAINPEYHRSLEVKLFSGYTRYTNEFTENPFSELDYGISFGVGLKRVMLKKKELFFDLKYRRGFVLLDGLSTNTFLLNTGIQIGK